MVGYVREMLRSEQDALAAKEVRLDLYAAQQAVFIHQPLEFEQHAATDLHPQAPAWLRGTISQMIQCAAKFYLPLDAKDIGGATAGTRIKA